MVRSFEGRVVGVVRGDDHEISAISTIGQLRQPLVEALDVFGHALGVAAVTVSGVEVNEVCEDQARLDTAQRIQNRIYFGCVVRRGGQMLCYATAVEDVLD